LGAVRTHHNYFAYVVVAANLIVGAWGLWLRRRNQPSTKVFWGALAAAWGTIYVQGLLGLTMFNTHRPPFRHHFYGFLFALITLLVFPLRGEQDRTRLLVFSIATLFIGIVAVRATLSL
jgi:drug/metabolite transporter superfamily protein YnfA